MLCWNSGQNSRTSEGMELEVEIKVITQESKLIQAITSYAQYNSTSRSMLLRALVNTLEAILYLDELNWLA